jgi:hypothetical protein
VSFAANPALAIVTSTLPNGTPNALYLATIMASGGNAPYSWSLTGGALPTGLILDPGSGAITGTPTNTGVFNFVASVSDSTTPKPQTANKSLSITITNIYGAGPGGPILVIANTTNPISSYYAEILLAEGLNEFSLKDISQVNSTTLTNYDVILLGQAALSVGQVNMLSNWVSSGGSLIAMRPDKQLAGLLGLNDASSTLTNAYLLVNTNSDPGRGIVGQTLQFHGTADLYTLGAATSLATLYSNAQTSAPYPAVTLRSVGSGQAAAFTFDLARSIVLTRQGNPAWSGELRVGSSGQSGDSQSGVIRAVDLFYGAASYDPQPNWVDLNKISIPQADEQQRLLANMILSMHSARSPLPRFWYFPHGYKAVVVMTADDHAGTYGSSYAALRFNTYLAASTNGGSVDDWTLPRCTEYIFISPSPSLTNDAQAAAYNAAGFEIGVHLNTGCTNYSGSSLDAFFMAQMGQFMAKYPSLPAQTTHRMHCIAWSDYSTPASVSYAHGIRLETSYYYWPQAWVADRPGFFTGSAIPMRFASTNGGIMDIYQATTQMTDESGQSYPYTVDTLLDWALGAEGFYGAFVANMHTDAYPQPQADAIFSSAMSRGVPIIASRQLLTWVDAKNSSSFSSIVWDAVNMRETFSVQASAAAKGIQTMLPVPRGYTVGSVQSNGSAIAYSYLASKGLEYVTFETGTGAYTVTFATDAQSPTISTWLPASGTTGVSWNGNITVAFSEAMNGLTTTTNTITLRDAVGNLLPAKVSYDPTTFTAVLRPSRSLRHLQTYTARVEGGSAGVTDVAGNPLANRFEWSFTTQAGAPYMIWSDSTVPTNPVWNDPQPYELGVKFTSDVSGYVTGIRFYKGGTANDGTHIGHLWTVAGGPALATATFTGETDSGWQEVAFATPVAITPNTIYIASYYAPSGHYAVDRGVPPEPGNLLNGVGNVPLRAVANSVSMNGVYLLGSSGFPVTSTTNGANYWVDVAFQLPLTLSGTVAYYPSSYPTNGLSTNRVGNVMLSLTGTTNSSALALGDGSYGLSNVPVGGTYCVTPNKNDDSSPANGITVADLAMIQAQVLGKLALGPYQLLAADVNTNGTITVADLALIQAVILGKRTNFPSGLWRFVPADFVFPDPVNPWSAPNPRWYTNRLVDATNGDFIAIKLGDVNGSWKPPVGGQSLQFDGPTKGMVLAAGLPAVGFAVGEQSAQPGQTVMVEVTVNGFHQATSAQFSLGWDPGVLRYAGTGSYGLKGLSAACFGTSSIDKGELAFAWYDPAAAGEKLPDGTVVFSVSFEVIGRAGSVSAVTLTGSPTPEEVSVDFEVANLETKDGKVAVAGPGVLIINSGYLGGMFQLSVPTEKGRSYTLESADALTPAKWTALPTMAGDGTVMVLTDLTATNRQRFYRVHVN